jgi:hypothetical protein
MRQVTAALALAAVLSGCGSPSPSGDVSLLIGPSANGCYTDFFVGSLVVDPKYGTAIQDQYGTSTPVEWQPGFTGWRVGSEVAVRDPSGKVVATTGHRYHIDGGVQTLTTTSPNQTISVWWACGQVIPQ